MNVLAIDYGTKRIGLATGDTELGVARPLPFVDAAPKKAALAAVAGVAKTERAGLLLIGLPRHMDGSLGTVAEEVKAFAADLEKASGLKVKFTDERLSTVQAGRMLHEAGRNSKKQRPLIDSMSAVVMLQSYLDGLQIG
ncbi:MAG: Holliday junction resolvase RuvX [Candidatus Methylacidiphilales bacterium]|nr:Holliday junction resolvase RuvX [Candidatus Methylacidiphilales bacterium]